MSRSSIGSPLLNIIRKGAYQLSPAGYSLNTTHPAFQSLSEIAARGLLEALKHPSFSAVTVLEFPYQATSDGSLVKTTFSILAGEKLKTHVIDWSRVQDFQLLQLRSEVESFKTLKDGGRLYRVWTSPRILQLATNRKPGLSFGGLQVDPSHE